MCYQSWFIHYDLCSHGRKSVVDLRAEETGKVKEGFCGDREKKG